MVWENVMGYILCNIQDNGRTASSKEEKSMDKVYSMPLQGKIYPKGHGQPKIRESSVIQLQDRQFCMKCFNTYFETKLIKNFG